MQWDFLERVTLSRSNPILATEFDCWLIARRLHEPSSIMRALGNVDMDVRAAMFLLESVKEFRLSYTSIEQTLGVVETVHLEVSASSAPDRWSERGVMEATMQDARTARAMALCARETRSRWLGVGLLAGAFSLIAWCIIAL
jgi:hypothetical protein